MSVMEFQWIYMALQRKKHTIVRWGMCRYRTYQNMFDAAARYLLISLAVGGAWLLVPRYQEGILIGKRRICQN